MSFIFLLLIIFIWWHLNSKITTLENKLSELSLNRPARISSMDECDTTQKNVVSPIPPYPHEQSTVQISTSNTKNAFIDWVSEDFLVKVGGLLVLVALGWFVSYAFIENWIGPMGRIALGLSLGGVVMAFGVWRMRNFLHQGSIFTVIGSTTIIMTLFAAREIYEFFTPATALGLMFLTVVLMAVTSLRFNLQSLAFATLVLGSIAPLLTNSPTPDVIGLFSYLLVMTLGTLWIVWQTGWTKLTLTSLVITFCYSLPFFFDSFADKSNVMLFMFLFVAIYFFANIISLVRRREEEMSHLTTHVLIAIGTAIFLVFWVESTSLPQWTSLLYSSWALVFSLGTYVIYLYTANKTAFYLYGAVAVGLLGVATASELSGPALTIAFLLEIGLLILVAERLRVSTQTIKYVSALLIVPFLLSLESLGSREWREGVLHSDFVVLLLAGLIFTSVASMFNYRGKTSEDTSLVSVSKVFMSVAGFLGVSLVWLTTHAIMSDDTATTVALVIYTVSGLAFYLVGRQNHASHFKTAGGVLIGGVVLRLLFVDVWDMNLEGRIITFMLIGGLLISTAFFGKKQKKLPETAE